MLARALDAPEASQGHTVRSIADELVQQYSLTPAEALAIVVGTLDAYGYRTYGQNDPVRPLDRAQILQEVADGYERSA